MNTVEETYVVSVKEAYSTDDCGICKTKLLPIKDELYCATCDIGETCLPGDGNEFHFCASCNERLAVWYPFDHCPHCFDN